MSNACRKVERQSIRKNSKSVEAFQSAWQEYREKKWGEGNVPRDTNKKKMYFADNHRVVIAEVKQANLIKQAIASKLAEKMKEKEKNEESND